VRSTLRAVPATVPDPFLNHAANPYSRETRHMPRSVELPPDIEAGPDGVKPAGWWHETDDGETLVCDLCPRACGIKPGKRGFCFVRRNTDGQLVTTTYGRSTGFCIDPIEKKPLNHFYPGTSVLSFGTAGCNLACKFCQNWTSSRSREVDAALETADPRTIARAAGEHGCRSVAFTYNDPIIWAEYAIDTAKACRAEGIKTVAVTSGYITAAARKPFYEVMDAANVDLKAFSEDFYHDLCGGHLEPVLDTLRWLARETDVWFEITNLVIPRANDSPEEIERMCEWIVEELGPEVPLHFSAFHPDFRMTDRERTPPETLWRARDIATKAGLRYVYMGNISHAQSQSTYCPDCGGVLIERTGYELGSYAMEENCCRHCGNQVAGRFDRRAGTWGSRRQPIRIAAWFKKGSGTVAGTARRVLRTTVPDPFLNHAGPKPTETEPRGETRMGAKSEQNSTDQAMAGGRPQLTKEQEDLVFQAAGRRVIAAVHNRPPEQLEQVLADLAKQPLLGAFVSLKRSGQLRSCCGFMGKSVPLFEAIDQAAFRAAMEDPRFPPISPTELEHLDMEVWLLWGMQPVAARGEDRVGAVQIGRHGLQISRGRSRGLLLPGVAVEHNFDARTFLDQVCRKAGLPMDAWKSDDTTLMTFEGYAISGTLGSVATAGEQAPAGPASEPGPTDSDVARLADFCRQNLLSQYSGATPSLYLPDAFDGSVCGAAISVRFPGATENIDCSQLVMRPMLPLQSTLFELTKAAAAAIRTRRIDPQTMQSVSVGLSVFFDPAMHGSVGEPDLKGVDPRSRAVVVLSQAKWAAAFDAKKTANELLDSVVGLSRLVDPAPATVLSLRAVSTDSALALTNVPRPNPGTKIRQPAVAGRFYPDKPAEIDRMIDEFLPEKTDRQPWSAAMVPHAGWIYSGKLAAEVFSRIEFPRQVIIVSPKHNRGGADWAVAPHQTWSFPGGTVPSDPDLAGKLAEGVSGLELDAGAHALEHSIEVQLPLLARLAPGSKVVGMAIHGGDLPALEKFAGELADVLKSLPSLPLLVISSDMNHFADEQETRRVDRMALDAMETLAPARLFKTVIDNRISMCGVLPAVLVMETLRRLDSLTRFESVGYATSAEASGDTNRVVGYAGMLLG
jgi:AmmeMemoRadiSam system radical SAM enzyme/AmmeMemoRadiSam system protein B/AmmeMemoRadiSam system protein A